MSSSYEKTIIKRELSDDDESKPTVQSGTAFNFARPVKLEETASQVCHVFGHMAKCTLGPISQVLPVNSREILEENLDELDSPLMDLYRTERRLKQLEEAKKANSLESSNMSSSNEPVRVKRELPDDDDESKSTVQSGTTSSSHVRPVKQEQFDESEIKPFHQLEATFSFAEPVKQENFQVKQEETTEPVLHVFGHMAKCTLGNQCTTPNCSTLKAMANHLFSCASADCSICGPFQSQSNNPLPQVSAQPIPVSQFNFSNPYTFQSYAAQPQQSQSSFNQSNSPLPQVSHQPVPGSTQANVPIPQPNTSQPQVSGLQPTSASTQILQQLLAVLRAARNDPQAKQQVVAILKSNPALMASFSKQRQQQLRHQELERQQAKQQQHD